MRSMLRIYSECFAAGPKDGRRIGREILIELLNSIEILKDGKTSLYFIRSKNLLNCGKKCVLFKYHLTNQHIKKIRS